MQHHDAPDELTDEQVAELLASGVLRPTSQHDERRPGSASHALGLLLSGSATALLVHAMTSLPRGVRP